jgi:hypothetical protein
MGVSHLVRFGNTAAKVPDAWVQVMRQQSETPVQKLFKAGSRAQLDVLNAQQQMTLTQRDLAQARYVFLLSKLRLASLAGDDALTSANEVNAFFFPVSAAIPGAQK